MTKNIAASIRGKLLLRSKTEDIDFNRMLVRYGIERTLYRISVHPDARDRFVLKGAMLFIAWPQGVPRPTGDLDLLGTGSSEIEPMRALFAQICAVPFDDGLVYDPSSVEVSTIREEQAYQGLRIKVVATLDGARITIQVDIGFGDVVYPQAEQVEFPTLIDGMSAPKIAAYPPATVIAEKFEAMVRFGLQNGRLKDYYDIWMIAQIVAFERAELVQAITATLQRRRTAAPSSLPVGLTAEFSDRREVQDLWKGFLSRTVPERDDLELARVMDDLRAFLGPVIQTLQTPEAATGRWQWPTGWQI